MRRCEAMWPLVLVPKLLSGSLNNNIIQDLFERSENMVSVLITHLDRRKRAGTSKDKLCRSYCDHKER